MQTHSASPVVSFDDEPLILVDPDDRVVGHLAKAACHDGAGLLHRAFSVFLFDAAGRVLLQQRSAQKRLWPLFWSNACCSHPRRGETVDAAAVRRTREELAVETPLRFAFKFVYQAPYRDLGGEHEMCSVYVGRVAHTGPGAAQVNANEVAATRFMSAEALDAALAESVDSADRASAYTPWLKLEWPRLRRHHWDLVAALG